jgi:Skp family chaperone for outer membrane proteins
MDRTREAAKTAEPRVRELAEHAKRTTAAARVTVEKHRPEAQRMARKAAERVKNAADAAKPQVNRLARQAKPYAERAAKRAVQYGQEHDEEIKRAATTVGRTALPRSLRIAVDALQAEPSEKTELKPEERAPKPESPA